WLRSATDRYLWGNREHPRTTSGVAMRTEDLILVSVDDHVVEPPSLAAYVKDHVPAKHKERVPRVILPAAGTDAWLIERQERASASRAATRSRSPRSRTASGPPTSTDPNGMQRGRPATTSAAWPCSTSAASRTSCRAHRSR